MFLKSNMKSPNPLPQLDTVIHSRIRLAVLSLLVSLKQADFNYLKKAVGATDGNLSTHLSKLEEAGYIAAKKGFQGKKPLSTYTLTKKGRAAFSQYVKALDEILNI